MRTINNRRPKAFIGAAISVGTQLIGGIIGDAKKRKAEEAARLEQERQAAQQQASYMTENAENDANVYKNIRNQLMRNGGNIPRKGVPLIAEGGTAIPIKKDSFLLKGRKHNTGGIIIGKGKNSIEAEGDEVVQITPKQLKVFSAQPILNGNSPAELVQKGAEPSKVFNAQESFKDRNGLNDDGTKKKRNMRTITGKKKLGGLSRKKDYGSKGFNLFKGIDKGEAISSGIGAAGTLISGLLNKGSIDKTSAPQVPTPQLIAPAKLKTSVNINPQLSDVRESELSQNRLVEGNTASSVASVARQQRISNNALSQRSRLRGEKENLETQLQNQDAINRQQVASSNAQQINEANRFNSISATQTANDKIQATANNRTQMIEGITSGVRDYQLGVDKKRSEENATAAMMSANPEQMELFLKLMEKNKGRLGNVRSTLFRCDGKKKIA